ncbi:Nickel-transporting ATPase [Sodalis praecaptivus]|uniref:ABC-type dipeptide transporter n=1 Tax=Sodalis praecaptivus TaxID=1239307 RepID=K7SKF0_9GAMM|nr:ABC transporter ATP-binding protein [Sodalis praecaptivus]AFW03789.1 Nickel-transporting ATPase [Sodalis praecaptivus]AHF78103.1 Nickel-transporting ATPase [Sodalis praecaptivus]
MPTVNPPLLQVDRLRITLPAQPPVALVNSLSFCLGQERVALVGESGSGKSLTARALMGLLPAPLTMDAAGLRFRGEDLTRLRQRDWNRLRGNGIAIVLQDPKYALNPGQTIGTQVMEPLVLHQRLGRRERQEKMLEMLAAVGLPDPRKLSDRYPHQLSGGMGQRVMLAIALINDPRLLIADEPTSALDSAMRDQVLSLIEKLVAERNMGLLLISHDLQQVAQHCERVMVMYRGELLDQLPAGELANATHPYTRTLWSCRPSKATRGQPLPVLDRATLGETK